MITRRLFLQLAALLPGMGALVRGVGVDDSVSIPSPVTPSPLTVPPPSVVGEEQPKPQSRGFAQVEQGWPVEQFEVVYSASGAFTLRLSVCSLVETKMLLSVATGQGHVEQFEVGVPFGINRVMEQSITTSGTVVIVQAWFEKEVVAAACEVLESGKERVFLPLLKGEG